MTVWAHRLSSSVRSGSYLSPDERSRDLDEDYEQGPIALNDISQGMDYQAWHLTWDSGTGNFTVTPETTGSPVVVLNAPSVTQCSLAFDQNGHVHIAYTSALYPYLYWYDSVLGSWATLAMPFGITTPTVCLDDKRPRQIDVNDILLFYTKPNMAGDAYDLYYREQRDRFGIEYLLAYDFPPYIYNLGMNDVLRVQIGASEVIL